MEFCTLLKCGQILCQVNYRSLQKLERWAAVQNQFHYNVFCLHHTSIHHALHFTRSLQSVHGFDLLVDCQHYMQRTYSAFTIHKLELKPDAILPPASEKNLELYCSNFMCCSLCECFLFFHRYIVNHLCVSSI